MMADLFWPADIVPSSVEWRIIDSTAVFNSALSGVTRTVSRPGTRFGCTMNFQALSGSDRSRVIGILSGLRGRSNRIWIEDDSYVKQGSLASTELLSNVTFATTTGWTSSNAELVLAADTGKLRLTRTAVVADRSAYASTTTANTVQYLFRAGVIAGRGNVRMRLTLGTTAGGGELVTGSTETTAGLKHVTAAATGTLTYAGVGDFISGRAADNFQIIDSPSVSRCALVNGASQTGSALWIDALPVSTTGLLKAGDMVAVYTTGWELKRLTADLNSNASGQAHMMFEPSLRASPADNAPISIYRPMARFLLAEDEVSWGSRPGILSDFSVSFVEDIA
jgi:hypothetical protein